VRSDSSLASWSALEDIVIKCWMCTVLEAVVVSVMCVRLYQRFTLQNSNCRKYLFYEFERICRNIGGDSGIYVVKLTNIWR
jgi:hypothetical protein